MTDFFSTLHKTGILQCSLGISFDGDTISVSLLPKSQTKDKALQSLKPITISGSVSEVDNSFFEIVNTPLEKAQTLIHNTLLFEKNLKESESKTQAAKKKKESARKKSEDLKKLVKANDFNPMTDHEKANQLAKEVLSIDPQNKEALKVVADMKRYENPSLF